jgi:hypothetical protein
MKKLLIILFLLFLLTFDGFSATRYWVGPAGGAWNNNANWSIASNGAGGASFPVAGDDAIFDGGRTTNCTLTTGAVCDNLQIQAGYTGTLNINSHSLILSQNFSMANGILDMRVNSTMDISGNFSITGGTFYKGTSIVTFSGTTTTTVDNSAGGGYDDWNDVIVNKSGGARLTVINNSMRLTRGPTNNLTINAGAILDIGGLLLTVNGTFTNNGTLRLQGGEALSANVLSGGPGNTVDYYSGYAGVMKWDNYTNLIIENGTRTVGANSLIGGNLQLTGGQFNLSGTQTLDVTGITTNNTGTIDGSASNGIMTFTGAVTNSGTIDGGSGLLRFTNGISDTGTVTGGSGGITVSAGGVSGAGGTFNCGSGTVGITGNVTVATFDGQTSTLTITGNVNNTSFNSPTTVSCAITGNFQTTNFASGNMTTAISGNFTVPDGTFTEGTGTINFTAGGVINQTNTFYNLTVSGGTRTTNGTVNVSQDLLISGGATLNIGTDLLRVTRDITITGTLTSTGGNVNVGRNWTRTGTFNNGNNLVTFNGGAGGTISGSTFYNLTINGTGTWTTGVTTVDNDLTITSGTFNIGGNALDVNRDVSFNGNLVSTGGNITVARNWGQSGAGAFTAGGDTVTFDTAATAVISGNTTFNNLTCTMAGKQMNFTAGTTQTVNGTLTLTGGAGVPANKIILRSTAASSWFIQVASPQAVTNVDVQYSDSLVSSITASSSINSGNNDDAAAAPHWIFMPNNITWSATAASQVWTTASNWDLGYVPNPTDNVTIQASLNSPILGANRTVNSMNLQSGYLYANGSNLTVTSGTFSLAGTLDLLGGETITTPSADTGTVNYSGGAGPYTIKNWSYYNLSISGTATFRPVAGTTAVGNNFSISNGIFDMQTNGADMNVIGGVSISGGTLNATNRTIQVGAGWNNTFGTAAFTETGSTVNFNGATGGTVSAETFNNLQFSGAGTWATGGTLTVNGAYTQSNGILNLTANTLDINSTVTAPSFTGGTVNISTGSLDVSGMTVAGGTTFAGTGVILSGAGSINGTGHDLTVNAGSTVTLATGSLTCNLFTQGGGTVNAGSSATGITCTGFSQTNGTFNAQNVTITDSGNFGSTGGTFDVSGGTSTVTITGAGTSTISGNNAFDNFTCSTAGKQIDFNGNHTVNNNFSVSTAGAAQTVNIGGTNTFATFSVSTTSAGQTINFPAGLTQTVTNFNISGQSGNLIVLQSSAAWLISASSASVTFADVSYSNAVAPGGDISATNSRNSGNNDDTLASPQWVFGAINWLGGTTNWNTNTNWSSGMVPTQYDRISIPVTANNPHVQAGGASVYNMSILGTASVFQDGNALTVNHDLNVTVNAFLYTGVTAGTGGNLTVTGTFTLAGTLNVKGNETISTIGANTGTVTYSGSVNNNLHFTSYYTLIINADNSAAEFTALNTATTAVGNNMTVTSGTLHLNAGRDLTVSGALYINGAGGTLDPNGRTVNVSGLWNRSAGTLDNTNGSSTVNFTGTNQIFNAEQFNNLTISGGTRSLNNDITVLNNWNITGGAFTHNNHTVTLGGTSGTQTVTTNGQPFYNLTVSSQAGRTVQLLDNVRINNDFIFSDGILDFNSITSLRVDHDLTVNGGTFTDLSGGVGMKSTLRIDVYNNFYAHATVSNIYFTGRGPVGSEWQIWIHQNAGPPANYARAESNNAAFWVYATYSRALDVDFSALTPGRHVGSARANWPTLPVTTITNCINWLDLISPYILNTRARLGDTRVYVEFSEEVREENTFGTITPVNFNTAGVTINTVDNTPFGGDNTRFILNLSAPVSLAIADILASRMNSNTAAPNRIVDTSFNLMNSTALYFVSHYQPVNPTVAGISGYGIGIDFFTNISMTSYTNTETDWNLVTDFSGLSQIYYDGLVLNATMDAGLTGTPQVQYILTDNIAAGNRFFVPPVSSGIKTVTGQNTGGNNWRFNIPVSESDGNKYIILVFSINSGANTWYCYRPLYAANSSDTLFYQCESYMVKLRRIVTQNNNTTILNNVINPVKGETTKLMYVLNNEGPVSIVVYDLNSDVVKVLKQETESSGTHTVTWDGKNENGKIVTRGVYFIRIRAPGIFNQIRKVLIVK